MFTFVGQTVSLLELIAFISGLLSVWLTLRMRVGNWPIGIVSVVCFTVLFVEAKLYADALLQLVFVALGFYGWWHWARAAREINRLPVLRATFEATGLALVASAVLTALCAWVLRTWTDSPLPWLDASILVLSLVATWAQARQLIECWWVWIAVDVISIPVYWSRALPLTALLYVLFLLLCVGGWRGWKARLMSAEAAV